MKSKAQIVIIGGGVIGLAIARALALRGVRDVMLFDRAALGAEASSAAAGMLAPQAEADAADEFFYLTCQSRDLYPGFAAALRDETGIDIELETAGTLYLAFTDEDEARLRQRYEWQTKAGLPVQMLTAEEARYLEPAISHDVRMALKFPFDTQVENRRLLSALAAANARLGVGLITGTRVESVEIQGGKVRGTETSRGFVAAEQVVISGGAWTSSLKISDKAASNPRIEPVRGQMLCFESNPQIVGHVIYSHRGYLVPRRDGRLLAGSTTEEAGFDRSVTAAGVQSISAAAVEICPDISAFSLIASWAGLRPRAADGLPVLGPCGEIEGLFYATGHYRNGILLAPITAELIAGAVVDKSNSPELNTFSPDRFKAVAAT